MTKAILPQFDSRIMLNDNRCLDSI